MSSSTLLLPLTTPIQNNPDNKIQIRFGTMGWTDITAAPEFKQITKLDDPLLAQAQLFSCVEVNVSHHQIPRSEIVQRWLEATTHTPQHIFHFKLYHELVPKYNEPLPDHFISALTTTESTINNSSSNNELSSANNNSGSGTTTTTSSANNHPLIQQWIRYIHGISVVPSNRRGFIVIQLPLGYTPDHIAHSNLSKIAQVFFTHEWKCAFEFRDRRWIQQQPPPPQQQQQDYDNTTTTQQQNHIDMLRQWMTPFQSVLIMVEELQHELFGRSNNSSNSTTTSSSMPLRLIQMNPEHIYVRIHRRQGQYESRTLNEKAVRDLVSILEKQTLPSIKFIWILIGTDWKDASLRNAKLIEKQVLSNNNSRLSIYPWPPPRVKTMLDRFLSSATTTSSTATTSSSSSTTTTTSTHPLLSSSPPHIICHLDLDSFYCEVERALRIQRGDMSLAENTPFIVAQYFGTGIISVSTDAKKRGVRRGMNIQEAEKACPGLITVRVAELHGKADLTPYRDYSERVMEIVSRHCSITERASIDEMYLDITSSSCITAPSSNEIGKEEQQDQEEITMNWIQSQLPTTMICTKYREKISFDQLSSLDDYLKNPSFIMLCRGAQIMERIRTEIRLELDVTASCGISNSKFLAKAVSTLNKPDGQCILGNFNHGINNLLMTFPIQQAIGFRGKLGEDLIQRYEGIAFLSDLANIIGEARLCRDYGTRQGKEIFLLASVGGSQGQSEEQLVIARKKPKSIGCSKTFVGVKALQTMSALEHWLGELANEIVERWERDKRRPTNVTVGIYGKGTRSMQVSMSTVTKEILMSHAKILLYRLVDEKLSGTLGVESLSLVLSGFPNTDDDELLQEERNMMEGWLKKKTPQNRNSGNRFDDNEDCVVFIDDDDEEEVSMVTAAATTTTTLASNDGRIARKDNVNNSNNGNGKIWSCILCTFINDEMRLRCEVCGADKRGEFLSTAAATSSSLSGIGNDNKKRKYNGNTNTTTSSSSSNNSSMSMEKWLKISKN
jgi:nucleotidyltransferase/DNA polymerase involved in DNA repair/uncharacterized protein YecE (DUF72 family)